MAQSRSNCLESCVRLPVTLALSLLLLWPSCAHHPPPQAPRIELREEGTRRGEPYVKLAFRPSLTGAVRERLTPGEAWVLVAALEEAFKTPEWRARVGLWHPEFSSGPSAPLPLGAREQWRRALEEYAALYGSAQQPLPEALPDDRFATAFMLSTRYMPEGVRAGAEELFSSRTATTAILVAGLTYLTLWLAPDPVFTKSAATVITVGLMAVYGVAEIINVAKAFMQFYREVSAATSLEELEAAARRFGEALGKVGVRIMAMVAAGAVSKALPNASLTGPGALWPPQRVAVLTAEGAEVEVALSAGTSAVVEVSTGTAVLMGVSTATAAMAGLAARSSARTTGDCRPESDKGSANKHHIATDKNNVSDATGGPWTPRFEELFARAGMGLQDPANIIFLDTHQGPHPGPYHAEVFKRLSDALEACGRQVECRKVLISELDKIAAEICTPGSKLNKLATKKP